MTSTSSDPVCNIGWKGRRQRYVIGAVLLAVGIVGSFLSKSFLSQAVAFFGFLSFFQAREGVCVAMAHRSARNMDDGQGTVPLEDADHIAYFNQRARGIYMKAFFATFALIVISRVFLIVTA
jgi:hypothetical protein